MKKQVASIVAGAVIMALPVIASAHVVVTPAQVGIGEESLFSISVPNERTVDVTSVSLTIPSGVTDVTPTVVPGWAITTEKSGDTVTAVTWKGEIPAGQRIDLEFQAQAPSKKATIDWKAYQTYADGTTVHWDQKPAGSDDADGDSGPYSVTKVIDDLDTPASSQAAKTDNKTIWALGLSIAALLIGSISIFVHKKD
jgi:uncharacterized protein YcnI